jgi:hypothetical protein
MKLRVGILVLGLIGVTALVTNQVVSQDNVKKEQKKPEGGKPEPGKPGAGPTKEEMKKMMTEMAATGPEHKRMEAWVGKWTAACKWWMDPTAEPELSKGTSESAWALPGRYVEQKFEGESMGEHFTGRGLYGYDKVKKKYFATWIDSMSTGIGVYLGTYDTASKTYNYTSDCDDPMTGKPMKMRMTVHIDSDTKHTMQMYMAGPDGKEFKCMEITYTKAM